MKPVANLKSPRASVLVKNGDSILMIHRLRSGNEYYVLPGGGVEEGETAEEAALRELKEETSILGRVDQKVDEFIDREGRTHYVFLCTRIAGEPKLEASSPENLKADENNKYEPMWVETETINEITVWPEGTREFLLKTFSNQNGRP